MNFLDLITILDWKFSRIIMFQTRWAGHRGLVAYGMAKEDAKNGLASIFLNKKEILHSNKRSLFSWSSCVEGQRPRNIYRI